MEKPTSPDIRWKQRFNNFLAAYTQLKAGIDMAKQRTLNDLEQQGLIQAFEFTHELAWNVIKDYFEYQGATQIRGSRDATREAFQKNLIKDGDTWMEMIKSRNDTSHTYNKNVAKDIADKIVNRYNGAFTEFLTQMKELADQ
jgi:nucleotidyltransferase substrate binding protein (TIGR01987 family)